jgi:hypothetical protein
MFADSDIPILLYDKTDFAMRAQGLIVRDRSALASLTACATRASWYAIRPM